MRKDTGPMMQQLPREKDTDHDATVKGERYWSYDTTVAKGERYSVFLQLVREKHTSDTMLLRKVMTQSRHICIMFAHAKPNNNLKPSLIFGPTVVLFTIHF